MGNIFSRVAGALIGIFLVASCASRTSHENFPLTFAPLGKGESQEDHIKRGLSYSISTQGVYASKAGEKMFEQGGNIIDAFTAVSFAISVERPQSTGLGGGGFALVYLKQLKSSIPLAVDFREKAPAHGHEGMFVDKKGDEIKEKSINGIFSAGVPGMVAGVLELHRRFGKLPLEKVMAPAIELAEKGFTVYPELALALEERAPILKRFSASWKIFSHNGEILKEGDLLVQKDLAQTLRGIKKGGAKFFYRGDLAYRIVSEFKRLGGLVSLKDLELYDVRFRDAVEGNFHGHQIFSMPPPSSGGVHVVQILNILENDRLKDFGPHHFQSIHLSASAMQAAFADRARYLGDSDFVKVPVNGLLSKEYAKEVRHSVPESHALNHMWANDNDAFKYNLEPLPHESNETTHFTIIDAEGNMVSSTQTINGLFGSGVVVPETGIVLNNEMDDFSTKPGAMNLYGAVGSLKNKVEPYKRPLSSMSPTLVFKDKAPLMALGTPNGTKIISCVVLTLLNYLEYGLSLYDSVALGRYHHQWRPDEIRIEELAWPTRVLERLKSYQHQLNFNTYNCRIQASAFEGGELVGVSDPRGRGLVSGK